MEFNARSAPGLGAAAAEAQRTRRAAAATEGSSEMPTTASADRSAPRRSAAELAAEAPHRDAAARGAVGEEERDAPEHDEAVPVAGHVVEKAASAAARREPLAPLGRRHAATCSGASRSGSSWRSPGRARRIYSGEARRPPEAPA